MIKHEVFEGPARIADWAKEKGHEISEVLIDREKLPLIDTFDFLVLMGGSMSVNDERRFEWLKYEKEYILEAIKAEKHVLGVCLGAQLVSNALGGRVFKNREKEIGWFPVYLTEAGRASAFFKGLPEEFVAFHWHGETFEIPPGCERLAYSDACDNQAFSYGDRVLGLQFHIETTPESAAEIAKECSDELVPSKYVQDAAQIISRQMRFDVVNRILYGVLDNLTDGKK